MYLLTSMLNFLDDYTLSGSLSLKVISSQSVFITEIHIIDLLSIFYS